MKKLTFALCVLLSGSHLAHAATENQQAAAGDVEAGKTKSATCAACHGPAGDKPLMPVYPKLAGQHAGYIEKQLQAFKGGQRQDPSMAPMAMPLSDQDMKDLAAYFASQPVAGGTADKEQAALGAKIYLGGNLATGVGACAGCHTPAGGGNPQANYPLLRGQNPEYTVKQLQAFKAGARSFDPNGKVMEDIAARMSQAEMDAVAQYISGLY